MTSKSRNKRNKLAGGHGSTPAVAMFVAILRIVAPLALITLVAAWFLSYRGSGTGSVRVTTSVPGADIYVAGTMTGFQSDTTLTGVSTGRQIITVRKEGFISLPEVVVADVKQGELTMVSFVLRNERSLARTDSIPPLRNVRQEIFSTGEPVNSVPPAFYRSPSRRLVDFSSRSQERSWSETPGRVKNEPSREVPINNFSSVVPSETDNQASASLTQITISSVPDGAQIIVNGTTTSRVTPYTFRGLEQGLYVFRLAKPGFFSKPDSITVSLVEADQTELAVFDLVADKTLPKPTLTVATTPPAAGIRIDGRAIGVGKAVLEVAYGSHKVEFDEVPGYRSPSEVTVVVTADSSHPEITGTYERLVGNSFLAVLPSEDAGVKFEGNKLRVFVDNELILDSPKERFDATLMGRIPAGKRLVRVEYGDLGDDIHLNLQDGEVSELTFRIESFFSKRKLRLRERDQLPLEKWEERSRRLTVLNAS